MADSFVVNHSPTIFGNQCLVATGKFEPAIMRSEAMHVTDVCENPVRRSIVTCQDEQLEAFLEEVNGLNLDCSFETNLETLPEYFPIMDFDALQRAALPDNMEFVGVTLCDIIKYGFRYKAGSLHHVGDITFHRNVLHNPRFNNRKVVLFLSGVDTMIEEVWHQRERCQLFDILKEMNLYAVVGFNFSVFGGECALGQALNIKRSLFSSELLARAGIRTIPHVYALTTQQVNRWVEWFKINPKVEYFSINCQLQKSQRDCEVIVELISNILMQLPYLHVIMQGFQLDSLHRLIKFGNRLHLADKVPVKTASARTTLKFTEKNNRLVRQYLERRTPTSLIENIVARHKYINSIIGIS